MHYARREIRSPHREVVISQGTTRAADLPAARAYAEGWLVEDQPLLDARERATEVGAEPVSPLVGATLRMLAATVDARAVVEVGTGTGVSALWLLRGMRDDAVLTSVDIEAEHQRLARRTLTDAGYAAARARLITGRGLDVLPRLSDGSYDLVFCHARPQEYVGYLTEALRLLRRGGVVAFAGVLAGSRVAEPSARDQATVALRELLAAVRDDERLVPVLLPVGDGLLAATVREKPAAVG